MLHYRMHGCTVSSDLPLHLPPADPVARPDLTLRRSTGLMDPAWEPKPVDVLAHLWNEAQSVGYVAARTPQGFRLRFLDAFDFDVSPDLSEATWTPASPAADAGLASVLAAGALMAFRLTMGGDLVLHASAVHARGRGLAFVGRSGMGKSTMATLLCAGGASLLTDDVGRIRVEHRAALIFPGGVESRLRPAAASLAERFGAVRETSDGRSAVALPTWAGGPVPLDAVVIPLPSRTHTEVAVQTLTPADALIILGQFPRLPGWVDTEVLAGQFDLLADLVDRVPVHLAVVPWGPPFTPATGGLLLDALGWPA